MGSPFSKGPPPGGPGPLPPPLRSPSSSGSFLPTRLGGLPRPLSRPPVAWGTEVTCGWHSLTSPAGPPLGLPRLPLMRGRGSPNVLADAAWLPVFGRANGTQSVGLF